MCVSDPERKPEGEGSLSDIYSHRKMKDEKEKGVGGREKEDNND